MKIQVRVITRHSPANYGSLLQSIATQKILDKIGVESKIIDYIALIILRKKRQGQELPLHN